MWNPFIKSLFFGMYEPAKAEWLEEHKASGGRIHNLRGYARVTSIFISSIDFM
jgi:hypothetical protein